MQKPPSVFWLIINWFPGSAWEPMSRVSASFARKNWENTTRILTST